MVGRKIHFNRYAPSGTKIVLLNAQGCLGFPRIVLVSNDYRLSITRQFDETAKGISSNYTLVSNETNFPMQITVYEKTPPLSFQIPPGRLDLPEQDLRFPVKSSEHGWQINGFVRLDERTPSETSPFYEENVGSLWLLTDYRIDGNRKPGTPVFKFQLNTISGSHDIETVLHTGEETANWDGKCNSCVSIYDWRKLLALLGSYSYPGAYQEYQAHIWGFLLNVNSPNQFSSMTITYLLPNGTGYFWGVFPGNR